MKKLTLIGGAPLAGKTTLSKKIAKEENAVELSTDSIRSWMKNILNKDDYPDLFCTSGMSAEEFYEKFTTPQSVVDEEIAEGVDVAKGVVALLNTGISWEHLVIEGIAVTPQLIVELKEMFSDREVEGYIVVDTDETRIDTRIRGRGLWGPLDTYPESLIPREVEWVILYNRWFEEQAKKYGVEIKYI